MQQKADLSQIQELASRMKRIDSNLEKQIMGMHSKIKSMLREVNQVYPESYVRTATREVEEDLNKIYTLAESISKGLRRRSDSLLWSANHYKHTEDQLKRKVIQPFAFTWRASRIGQSPSVNVVASKGQEASVFKISGTSTFMGMLKNLWSKAQDALLIKKLAPFQEDKQISSLIKQLQSGTIDQQKVARQQLSEILQAFDEIARSQVAYGIYGDFGNETYREAAQKQANLNREVLTKLGGSDEWYNMDVNLAENYKDSPLSACRYNPLKEDRSAMPDLAEMTLILTAARINEPYREWVKANYEQVESTVKQAAQQRQAIQEIVDEYNRSMSPDEIKEIQTQLQTMNYYHGEVTGKYTADLLAALDE